MTVTPGTNLLQAALYIPHLCYDPRLEAYGACRLCLVEIEGRPGVVTVCTSEASRA